MIEAAILFSSVVKIGRTTISSVVVRLKFGDAGRAVLSDAFIELSIFRIDMNILKMFVRERKRYYVSKILRK
jgi:hypothetical protein